MAKTAAPILRFLLLFAALLAVGLGLAALSPSAADAPGTDSATSSPRAESSANVPQAK
jgi:hypothetical protein